MSGGRLDRRFAALRAEGRAGFVAFITAGDPDPDNSLALMKGLATVGADIIELGMPFSDPMADGPTIQAAGLRALKAGANMSRTLDMVRAFRRDDAETPVVLMGYYNPVYAYGTERFVTDAVAAGVDGVIIVDLPPEEDAELITPARKAGLNVVRLTAPTTPSERLPVVLGNASGFIYHVSVTGVTGTKAPSIAEMEGHVARLKSHTDLPIVVGFGIRTPAQAAAVARVADAAAVGSALVQGIADGLDGDGRPKNDMIDEVLALAADLAEGVRSARAS